MMRFIKNIDLRDILWIVGLSAITIGVGLIAVPWGVIAFGIMIIGTLLLSAVDRRR